MSTRTQLVGLALAAFAMATVQWCTRRPAAKPTVAAATQFFAHCAACGLEMTCPSERADDPPPCPHCGTGRRMEINTFSRNNGETPAVPLNRRLLATAFGVPAALAVGVYYLGRRAKERQSSEGEEEVCRFKCPGCGHGMTSTTYRRGSTAICPACAEVFVVASLDGQETADRNGQESHRHEDRVRPSFPNRSGPRRSKRRASKSDLGE